MTALLIDPNLFRYTKSITLCAYICLVQQLQRVGITNQHNYSHGDAYTSQHQEVMVRALYLGQTQKSTGGDTRVVAIMSL